MYEGRSKSSAPRRITLLSGILKTNAMHVFKALDLAFTVIPEQRFVTYKVMQSNDVAEIEVNVNF